MHTFDVGEYVTKNGSKAVVEFILPNPKYDSGCNRVGYIETSDGKNEIHTWTKEGKSYDGDCDLDLQVPRHIQWKVRCVENDTRVTYGPYSTDSLNSLFRDNIFKLYEQVEVIQCIELDSGERLIGDKIVKVKPWENSQKDLDTD